eukprot:jgi/Chrzof1/360/Cz01g13030.t1
MCCRYTENQFDSEFIDVLRETCFKFVSIQGDTTLASIASFISSKGFAKVELRQDDIKMILDTLIYDGRIDQVESPDDDDDHYRPAVLAIPDTTPYTSIPCGVCPVFRECHEGGQISPQTCVYYQAWLDF